MTPDCGVNSSSQACEKVIAIVSKNDNLICSLDKLQKLPAKYNKGSHCFLRKMAVLTARVELRLD